MATTNTLIRRVAWLGIAWTSFCVIGLVAQSWTGGRSDAAREISFEEFVRRHDQGCEQSAQRVTELTRIAGANPELLRLTARTAEGYFDRCLSGPSSVPSRDSYETRVPITSEGRSRVFVGHLRVWAPLWILVAFFVLLISGSIIALRHTKSPTPSE